VGACGDRTSNGTTRKMIIRHGSFG
jgi:hypothetical protein